MNYWMCTYCNAVFENEVPPEVCPDCHQKCTFTNVSCYIPECGGEGHIDAKLVERLMKEAENKGN